MKKHILICVLIAICAIHAQSQNLKFGKPTDEELNMTVYEQDPNASAVVLCNLTTVNYSRESFRYLVDYNVKKRIKILKDNGKDYANMSIKYINNPYEDFSTEEILDFNATAYNMENGKVVKTKIGADKLYRERIDEEYVLAKFAVPQAKAGTVIEVEYKLHSDVFYHIHDWYAQEEIPVAYTKYELSIPATLEFNVEASDIKTLKCTVTRGNLSYISSSNDKTLPRSIPTNVYTCVGNNLEALKKNDFVWNVRDYAKKVTAEMKGIHGPDGQYRVFRKEWQQIDNTLLNNSFFGSRLNDHSPFRDELKAIRIAEIENIEEKVAATFKLLLSKLAWDGEYKWEPLAASKVVKKGSGSNVDLNMIFINMLGDVGIQAVPVLLSTRSHGRLPKTYPSLDKLSTFIVGIPNGSSWIFIDASSGDGYLNVLPANLYTDQARILQKNGGSQWVNLEKISEAHTKISIKAQVSPEGVMSGEEIIAYSGNAAANERKAFRLASDSAAFIATKAKEMAAEIDRCQMEGHRDFSPTVKETILFSRRCDTSGDHMYISPFIDIPISSNPFTEKERTMPIEFPYLQNYSMTVQLDIPEGWQLEETIENKRVVANDGTISGQILCEEKDNNSLILQYRFRLNSLVFSQDKYDTLKQLFDILANHSKEMIVIKRK